MSKKKIAVVTGAAGFIGSHMVDLLRARDYRVHAIDNLVGGRLENLQQYEKDAELVFEEKDLRALEADDKLFSGADYVIHFAGIGDISDILCLPFASFIFIDQIYL